MRANAFLSNFQRRICKRNPWNAIRHCSEDVNSDSANEAPISDKLLIELQSNRRKAIHMLVSNFTAPALASALVDREKTLARCARLFSEKREAELAEILAPFEIEQPKEQTAFALLTLTPKFLASLEVHLSRLPRVYQGVSGPLEKRASVLIPLCHDQGVPSVLFTRRSEKLKRDAGEICFPGGMIDRGDFSVKDAALREMEEELGINRVDVQIIGVLRCDWSELVPFTGIAVTPIVAMLIRDVSEIRMRPNPDEVDNWFTIPLKELDDDALWIRKKFEMKTYSPVFNRSGCTIWGLTAYIADRLMRKVIRRSGQSAEGAHGILEYEIKAAIGNPHK